jgi:predicted Zn-dependent peptidase
MVNRSIPPKTNILSAIPVPQVEPFQLQEAPLFVIGGSKQPLIKLDIVFKAGEVYTDTPLKAIFTNTLMLESTQKHTAIELAESLDFIGAEINPFVGNQYSSFSLITLTKHFQPALEILTEMLNEPLFSEADFTVFRDNHHKQFSIDMQNVSYIARRHFKTLLFGKEHPYSRIIHENDFENIATKQLKDLFARLYNKNNVRIFISGDVNNHIINILNNSFDLRKGNAIIPETPAIEPSHSVSQIIKKDDAVQSAIRIGKIVISKTHPDYPALQIATTVLGGYFGSRLMQVLREEKGYTYGVGASLVSLKEFGYFVVATEVAKDVTHDAVNCIYKEIEKLCTEEISSEELENVRSYLFGEFLRLFDGPFNIMESFKAVNDVNQGMDYYSYYLDVLTHIQPHKILETANRYLLKNYTEVIVGNVN